MMHHLNMLYQKDCEKN